MNAPDELTDDEFNSLPDDDVREIIADENRWMRTSIDAIPWPTAITIRPVEVNLVALAMARMAMEDA